MCGVYRDWSSYAIGETMNALFQSEAFIDSLKIHCVGVKQIFVQDLYCFLCFQGQRRDRKLLCCGWLARLKWRANGLWSS